jgi:Domain of Unknown Function (DUF1080)
MKFLLTIPLLITAAHAQNGPQPPVVNPGAPGQPPSDAIVLFDGTHAREWVHKDGRAAEWKLEAGALVCNSGKGDLYSKRKIGSAQFHIEFSAPFMPNAKSQARGNSGVYIQNNYEIQILDSFENPTYANGSCAALYGQYAPLVNVCRKPGEWQSYDIVFHAPACDASAQVTTPGTLTVLHNGVLVQDHVTIKGKTSGAGKTSVCEPGPLMLQDHFHPDVKETFMKFRNIWYRSL